MNKEPKSIQVIDRMTLLLDAIAAHGAAASLKYLSADTGLHPSTAYRILASMTAHGYVQRDPSGSYLLGHKLFELGCRVNARLDLRHEAQGIMEQLRDELGESVNLTIREGDQVVYVERAIANRMMRVEQVIGSRAPLHVTAVGKLMLATGGERAIEEYAGRTGLPGLTKNTLTDLKRLKAALGKDLARGYALDNEEAELGVGCIGALIRGSAGDVIAGLSISAPMERRRDDWIAKVVEAARTLSARMGYRESGE